MCYILVSLARVYRPPAAEAVLLLARQTERSRLVSTIIYSYILMLFMYECLMCIYRILICCIKTCMYALFDSYLILIYSFQWFIHRLTELCFAYKSGIDYTCCILCILLYDIYTISYYCCTCVLLCACLNLYLHVLYYTINQARRPKPYTRMSTVKYIYT